MDNARLIRLLGGRYGKRLQGFHDAFMRVRWEYLDFLTAASVNTFKKLPVGKSVLAPLPHKSVWRNPASFLQPFALSLEVSNGLCPDVGGQLGENDCSRPSLLYKSANWPTGCL